MFILGILCVLTAAVLIYINYRNTKKTMETIGRMLDAAAEGAFQEAAFDESRLSALETKYAHYLSSSAVSAQNLTIEKDKIKTLIADFFKTDHLTTPLIRDISQRYTDRKFRPDIRFTLHLDRTLMQQHRTSRNGKAKPGAPDFPGMRLIHPVKSLKNIRLIFPWYSNTAILYNNRKLFVIRI